MKKLVWISICFELKANKHDMQIIYPDRPNFVLKACCKFVKYLLDGRLRYIHFSYHYKRKGKLLEEPTYTIKDIVKEWTDNS